jgi:eukaryotic-like serine/threonine-protein kinase
MLARMIVEQGLATVQDVEECRQKQQKLGSDGGGPNQRSLASLLISGGVVTQKQIDRLRPQIDEHKVGQQIPGYILLEKLGAGAMATVYKARQVSLDRTVAIKILPHKQTNNPEFVQRFYAEGRAAAKLNHPNIVGAVDVGKAADRHYFVMEYVEGKTVYDDIMEHGRYAEDEALRLIIQIARALDHAHKAGFIHRDVKPKNIMITKEGVAKLADMGLARAVSDREAAEAEQGKAFGTPYYISPEQIRGDVDVDFRADIYGLGATMYHMVTGQIPFEAATPTAVMHKHLKAKLVPPDHLNPNLSAGISEIIEVCMAKDRNERYNTTADLLQDLEAVARGETPMQARRKFDLASLTTLEEPPAPPAGAGGATVDLGARAMRLATLPIFWVAVVGWLVSLCLLIALLILNAH